MNVEQRNHQFPKGLRVLAVDDDPSCLFILDRMLKKCEYQVTITTKAVTALNMLRENNDRFDLVITDVQMPDMDGFQLLEQVGLEMDIPVILLSAYDEPKLLMKGIDLGACDYLLKPASFDVLKIIWKHVLRKKKSDSMGQRIGSDQTGKLNNKRKSEDNDENVEEIEDTSTQKRPRVIWCEELHRRFLNAVEHLGIDGAEPKKIIELMNVKNLSRENVASHLQKFRLSIKKIKEAEHQRAIMASAYNNTNASSFRLGYYNGLAGRSFDTLSGLHVQNQPVAPYSQQAMMGRSNSAAGFGIYGPCSSSSSGMVPFSGTQHALRFGNQASAFRYSGNWPNAVQSNSFGANNHYRQGPFSNVRLRDNNIPRQLSQIGRNSFQDLSSSARNPNSANNSSVAIDKSCSSELSLDLKKE